MSRLDRKTGWTLTVATVAAMSISYVDRQTLNVLSPTVTKALHIDDAAYGWLGSAFNLAYLAGAPLAGALVDRVGARRSLPAAMLVWSFVAVLHALAPGFGVLLALRLALGLAESPSFPSGVQVVRSALPADEQPRGTSTLYVGMSLGALLAPALANTIAATSSWRWAFVGTGALAAAWIPLWAWLTRGALVREALDVRPVAERAGKLEAVRHPAMLRGLVGMMAVTPMSVFMLAWEAKLYVAQAHLTQTQLTPYLMASAVLYDLGALVGGDLASRRARATGDASTPRGLFAAGLLVAVAGPLALSVAHQPTAVLVGMCLSALGRGAVIPLAISDALVRMPKRVAAAAGGVVASAYALAGVIVNPIVGAAVRGSGYLGVVLGLATWTTVVGITWLAWPPARVGPVEPEAGRT